MAYYNHKKKDESAPPPNTKKLYCNNCNKVQSVHKDASFCSECGGTLDSTYLIHSCGANIPAWTKFCSFCGEKNRETTGNEIPFVKS